MENSNYLSANNKSSRLDFIKKELDLIQSGFNYLDVMQIYNYYDQGYIPSRIDLYFPRHTSLRPSQIETKGYAQPNEGMNKRSYGKKKGNCEDKEEKKSQQKTKEINMELLRERIRSISTQKNKSMEEVEEKQPITTSKKDFENGNDMETISINTMVSSDSSNPCASTDLVDNSTQKTADFNNDHADLLESSDDDTIEEETEELKSLRLMIQQQHEKKDKKHKKSKMPRRKLRSTQERKQIQNFKIDHDKKRKWFKSYIFCSKF
ncbi:hypothetical protein QTN25_003055 [Entamoeba marina]